MANTHGCTRSAAALTHRTVEALRPEGSAFRVPDSRCAGLAIRVAPGGLKTWDLAFRISRLNKVRRVSLGRFEDVSIEDARHRANDITRAARAGRDLLAEECAAVVSSQERITVRELIALYVKRRVAGRLRTAKEIEGRLRRGLHPVIDHFAADLRKRDFRKLLDDTADQGFPREAEQRRLTIGTMFKWAASQDFIDHNPVAGLSTYGRSPQRERVLATDEIRALWHWLEENSIPEPYAELLKLQLLLGARCSEVGGLHSAEVDTERWIWTLPPSRSKNGKQRLTPLVGSARAIIENRLSVIGQGNLYVTATGSAVRASNVGNCLNGRRRELPIAKFTTHDLRRTTITMLAEMNVPLEVVASIVGHEVGGSDVRTLVRHYVRTEFLEHKIKALTAWDAKLCETIATQGASGAEWISPLSADMIPAKRNTIQPNAHIIFSAR